MEEVAPDKPRDAWSKLDWFCHQESGLSCWPYDVSLHSPVSTDTCGPEQSMMLTCGLEFTQAQCCAVCWGWESGSLMSGLGTWISQTSLNLEESLGKSKQSSFVASPLLFLNFMIVGFLYAQFRSKDVRSNYLKGDQTLKHHIILALK